MLLERPFLSILLVVGWLALVIVLRRWRVWLPYYFVGSVGFTILVVLLGHATLEPLMSALTAQSASLLSNQVGMATTTYPGVTGMILVLVIRQPIGWTLLNVGVECSGLLESAALAGLTIFYPLWKPWRRFLLLVVALIACQIANVLRVMTIIGMLHWGGKDFLVIAHSLVGRGVFFAIVLAMYWLFLTVPTINQVARRLQS